MFAMRVQYKPKTKELTSSNTYFYGFVLHHCLCILGLSVPIFNRMQTMNQSNQCGHLQEEHQWLHEGCSWAIQGPTILCWRVHGQRRDDYDHGLQGLPGRGETIPDRVQAWS